MPPNIISKVHPEITDQFNVTWECPGCGFETTIKNPHPIVDIRSATEIIRTLHSVKCPECCRKFDTK